MSEIIKVPATFGVILATIFVYLVSGGDAGLRTAQHATAIEQSA